PGCEVSARSNRQRNAARKAGIHFDETHVPAVPFALDVCRTDNVKLLRNVPREIDDVGILASDSFIADAGANHQTFAWNDREHPALKIGKHIDGEFGARNLVLHDRIGNVVQEQAELRFILDREYVYATPAKPRFDVNRITQCLQINGTGQACLRRANAVSLTEQIRFILVVTGDAGLFAG